MTVADVVRADLDLTHAVPAASAAGRRVQSRVAHHNRIGLIVTDVVLAVITAFATVVVFSTHTGPAVGGLASLALPTSGWVLGAALPAMWVFCTFLGGGYERDRHDAGVFELRRVLLTGALLLAALPLAELLGLSGYVSPAAGVAIVVLTASAVLTRAAERRRVRQEHAQGTGLERLAVVGDPTAVDNVVGLLERDWALGLLPAVAFVPTDAELSAAAAVPVLTGLTDPNRVVRHALAAGATGIVVAPGQAADTAQLRAIARAAEWAGLSVMLMPGVVDLTSTGRLMPLAGTPIVRVPKAGPSGVARFTKNAIDKVGAGLGLLLLAPVFAIVVALVRLDTPGPAIFRQRRVGAGGREFTMLKFRSMSVNAEAVRAEIEDDNETTGCLFKVRDDPRITRVGRILRTTSIDELPQLINVFLGQMSLVGPRPPLPSEVARYTAAERRRLLVKPGLTGLWQVSGRSNLDWSDAVRLDLTYLSDWSVSMDLRLLARTAAAVARREGAY